MPGKVFLIVILKSSFYPQWKARLNGAYENDPINDRQGQSPWGRSAAVQN